MTLAALAKAKCLPIAFLLGLGLSDLPGGGMGIPYYGLTGEDIAIKRRTALTAKDGSFWPKGTPLAPYGQNRLDRAARAGFLIIVEGESDAWTLWYHELPALGLPGASTAGKLLREHVDAVQDIYISREPDNGGATFIKGVVKRLGDIGFDGRVFELVMPDGVKDPSDLHICNPATFKERLKQALRDAAPIEMPHSARTPVLATAELEPVESPDDPHYLARLYLADNHPEGSTLRYWREQWSRWDGKKWVVLPDAELHAALQEVIHAEFIRVHLQELQAWRAAPEGREPTVRKVTKGLIANTELALTSLTMVAGNIEQPAWWDGLNWVPRNLIALSNGLLDLDAFFAGKADILLPHTPRWFSGTCLPYPFDPEADCPRWRAFLDKNLEGDTERIAVVQEWFGHSLTHDMSRQKFLALEGEGANGKSVVCAVLEGVLGSDNCSHVSLEVFGERFQLGPTLGKLANICSEVGELDKVAEAQLKQFTSGDPMMFDRKHKPPINARPTARLVLATNNRPRFSDRSGGLWRRMILMPFRVTIQESERVFGMDKPDWWKDKNELPGIFNWALAGLDRLRTQDRFTRSRVCEDALGEYRVENNPARMFLLEKSEASPDGQMECGPLYQKYRDWCQANGYSPLADRAFGKEVKRALPNVERRYAGSRGSRAYVYAGMAQREGVEV